MSRLNKKRDKVEELTGVRIRLDNGGGDGLHAFIDMPTTTWHQGGSVRELMAWMEGVLIGVQLERGELERRARNNPVEATAAEWKRP